ncbi:hypothetical protein HQN90_10295 [Paenibacillus alba]|uniref:DUF6444 domain-containing protein n=1 Tax=Paenibacillus alba TaxID=1197127 RepID=UPI001565199E|nr:DUF6444 domain-containing protein [Paenibacillus alba]NQX66515.1 hypothetical protein [Paenibacillus alba]
MNIEEIDRIMLSDLASIKSLILSLVAKVEHLENENKELKRQLGQNSQNSSWPPSSDLKREPKNHRKSGGKKGGPVGHKGNTLSCITVSGSLL